MTAHLTIHDSAITCETSKVGPADFLRALTGKPPRTAAEIAEADARIARIRLAELIHRTEYAKARVEREKIIREGKLSDETYEEWHARLNGPFCRAADRVNAQMAAQDQARAA